MIWMCESGCAGHLAWFDRDWPQQNNNPDSSFLGRDPPRFRSQVQIYISCKSHDLRSICHAQMHSTEPPPCYLEGVPALVMLVYVVVDSTTTLSSTRRQPTKKMRQGRSAYDLVSLLVWRPHSQHPPLLLLCCSSNLNLTWLYARRTSRLAST